MPTIDSGGVRLQYEVSGDPNGAVLVLANSLGSNLHMWDKVLPAFERRHRVLRYDMRGHGKSSVASEPFTLRQLGCDLLRLLDELEAKRVNVCGLSLGGQVALWLGMHAPERVNRLILANTATRIGNREMWEQRIATVLSTGMSQLAAATLERWFTPAYRAHYPEEMEQIRKMIAATEPAGYAACCSVLRDTDLRGEVETVKAPSLVITGTHDPATPPGDGRTLHNAIRNSSYVELDASHLSAWERAEEFGEVVLQHLAATEGSMDERDRHEVGMQTRRSVLGDAHVDRAEAAKTDLDSQFQDLITRYAWGEIWTRPGLPKHTRSLLTIGLMVALNRSEELRLHLRAAASNGVTAEEIREVLMHCAIYCGVPAANAAFHAAKEILSEQSPAN